MRKKLPQKLPHQKRGVKYMTLFGIPGVYTTKEIKMELQRGKKEKKAFLLKDNETLSALKNLG